MRLEIAVTAPGIHGLASKRVAAKVGLIYEGGGSPVWVEPPRVLVR